MKVELISTPNRISTLRGAMKYCQNFARICYSEKDFDEVRKEKYNSRLVENRLIKSGHHSIFDHFNMSLYFEGLPKAMAMVLNNEPPYATSEKSARYTEMKKIPKGQKILYDKWKGIFVKEIDKIYPDIKRRDDGIVKLAQENARYVTSVFTPTKMGYTLSLRQLNVLADKFEKIVSRGANSVFTDRLIKKGILPFLSSDIVRRFRIDGLESKDGGDLKLFRDEVEEHFGEDVYSTNLRMSFACLAQDHRHRTIHNHIVDTELSPWYFVPPIIREDNSLTHKWVDDLDSVSESDFPQGQIIEVAERGNREDLEMKLRERNCGLVQLEIVRVMDGLLQKYSEYVPEMGELRGASCLVEKSGCKKGGCVFGPEKAISRLV